MFPVVLLLLRSRIQMSTKKSDEVAMPHACRALRVLTACPDLHEPELAEPHQKNLELLLKKLLLDFKTLTLPGILLKTSG